MEKMEIKLPKDAESMICNVDGNKVILEFIPKNEFQDGDILASDRCIVIYNGVGEDEAIVCYGGLNTSFNEISFYNTPGTGFGYINDYRHATEEEKQKLFDAMAKEGMTWNAEKKQIEKKRWRAKKGDYYYYIDSSTMDVQRDVDFRCPKDDNRYRNGNYAEAKYELQDRAEKFKELLKDRRITK